MDSWQIRTGRWLFRHRSVVPLPLIGLLLLCFRPGRLHAAQAVVTTAGLLLSLAGEAIRIRAVGFSSAGTSGRESFFKAAGLNTTGPYSITRNPLYSGNLLIFSGLLAVYSNPAAWLIGVLFLAVHYHFIILAEEHFLRETHGDPYLAYCLRIRRWVPRFSTLQSPGRPFNLKKVIFKENDSCFNLAVFSLIILAYREKFFGGTIQNRTAYLVIFLLLAAMYIGIKVVKKRQHGAGS